MMSSSASDSSFSAAGEQSNADIRNNEKLLNFKETLTKEGHVEEKGGVMSYVANDFLEKLKINGEFLLASCDY